MVRWNCMWQLINTNVIGCHIQSSLLRLHMKNRTTKTQYDVTWYCVTFTLRMTYLLWFMFVFCQHWLRLDWNTYLMHIIEIILVGIQNVYNLRASFLYSCWTLCTCMWLWIWLIGNWFCLLDIRFVDDWQISCWILYM